MKLAEALIERADLQRKIAQIEARMRQNVKVQEGDKPTEYVDELLPQYESLADRLECLIANINRTNSSTPFNDITLAHAITKRDCLKSKIHAYRELCEAALITQDRYSNKEIRFVRCVDVVKLQKRIDDMSKAYRELDTKMQGLNWTTDLLE